MTEQFRFDQPPAANYRLLRYGGAPGGRARPALVSARLSGIIGRLVLIVVCIAGTAFGGELDDALAGLGARTFAEREAAMRRIVELADRDPAAVLPACARYYRASSDPEVRYRLRRTLAKLVDKHLYRTPRGFLGIRLNNVVIQAGGRLIINGVEMPSSGIWVGGVIENSAAEKAGLLADDVIIAVDDLRPGNPGEFTRYIQSRAPGTRVRLEVVRAGATNVVEATLGELPAEQAQQILTEEGSREFFKDWLKEQTAPTGPPSGR